MAKSNTPKSMRKHIRTEKAKIRRSYLDPEKRREKIEELYKYHLKDPRNVPAENETSAAAPKEREGKQEPGKKKTTKPKKENKPKQA